MQFNQEDADKLDGKGFNILDILRQVKKRKLEEEERKKSGKATPQEAQQANIEENEEALKIDLDAEHGKTLIEERLAKFRANLSTCLRFRLQIHNMSDDTVAHLLAISQEPTIRNKLQKLVLFKFGKMFNDEDGNNLAVLKQSLNHTK